MNNPYVMNMIVKQRQEGIRKQAELYNRIDRATSGSEERSGEGSVIALRGLMLTIFLLGLIILV
jgi:hypothetical protein